MKSAITVAEANIASTWPRFTASPTLTLTLISRRPSTSAPMLASSQGATFPVAQMRMGSDERCRRVAATVSAGLATAPSSAASLLARVNTMLMITTAATTKTSADANGLLISINLQRRLQQPATNRRQPLDTSRSRQRCDPGAE